MKQNSSLNNLSNEELWELFPIILSEHKAHWKEEYLREGEKISRAFREVDIYRMSHIGSTSVVGLLAKPTIDILLEVNNGVDPEYVVRTMEGAGYLYSPQPKNPPPHMMFLKGYTPRGFRGQVYHVHVRFPGDWDELYFRDYLRDHPAAVQEYAALKILLKNKFEHDRDAYTDSKTGFVRKITDLARKEYSNRYIS